MFVSLRNSMVCSIAWLLLTACSLDTGPGELQTSRVVSHCVIDVLETLSLGQLRSRWARDLADKGSIACYVRSDGKSSGRIEFNTKVRRGEAAIQFFEFECIHHPEPDS